MLIAYFYFLFRDLQSSKTNESTKANPPAHIKDDEIIAHIDVGL